MSQAFTQAAHIFPAFSNNDFLSLSAPSSGQKAIMIEVF